MRARPGAEMVRAGYHGRGGKSLVIVTLFKFFEAFIEIMFHFFLVWKENALKWIGCMLATFLLQFFL